MKKNILVVFALLLVSFILCSCDSKAPDPVIQNQHREEAKKRDEANG